MKVAEGVEDCGRSPGASNSNRASDSESNRTLRGAVKQGISLP